LDESLTEPGRVYGQLALWRGRTPATARYPPPSARAADRMQAGRVWRRKMDWHGKNSFVIGKQGKTRGFQPRQAGGSLCK